MAFAHPPRTLASRQQPAVSCDEVGGELGQNRAGRARQDVGRQRVGETEDVRPIRGDRLRRRVRHDRGARGGAGMEVREEVGEALEHADVGQPVADQPLEGASVGQPPHPHHGIDDVPGPVERQVAGRVSRDRNHAQVDRRRQAPVQPQLLFAEGASPRGRGGVEEREADRLLQLVGVRTGQEHVRDVRLHVLYPLWPVGIEGRVSEGRDQRGLVEVPRDAARGIRRRSTRRRRRCLGCEVHRPP